MNQYEKSLQQPTLFGAGDDGKAREFALLEREAQHVRMGLESYRVPEDVDALMRFF